MFLIYLLFHNWLFFKYKLLHKNDTHIYMHIFLPVPFFSLLLNRFKTRIMVGNPNVQSTPKDGKYWF